MVHSYPDQLPPNPTASVVGHVVFGQSLKMHALRHVLQTLEMTVVEPEHAVEGVNQLRISFDSCDAEACAARAAFVRSLNDGHLDLLQFPIGRVPDIGPLFEKQPVLRNHQGSVFDPEVEEFRSLWSSALHRLTHFARIVGVEDQHQWLKRNEYDANAAKRLADLLRFTCHAEEFSRVEAFIQAVASYENRITAWAALARTGNEKDVIEQLSCWELPAAVDSGSATHPPVEDFVEMVLGLGGFTDFKTSVSRLAATPVATLAAWRKQIDQLPNESASQETADSDR